MGVTFNEPKYSANTVVRKEVKPFFLSALILNMGLAKNKSEVQGVLLCILVILVLLTGWVVVSGSSPKLDPNVPDPDSLL